MRVAEDFQVPFITATMLDSKSKELKQGLVLPADAPC
jgi:hypothetical protein